MEPLTPDWVDHQRRLYLERLQLLVGAGMRATGRIPVVLMVEDGHRSAARLDPIFCLAERPTANAIEVADHAGRAWDEWARGLDPFSAGVFLAVEPDQAKVLIAPLSAESTRMFDERAPALREAARQGGVDVEPYRSEATRDPAAN